MTIPRWFLWLGGFVVSAVTVTTGVVVFIASYAVSFSGGQARVENEFKLLRYTLCAADSTGPRSYYCDPGRSFGVAAAADNTRTRTVLHQVRMP